MRLWAGLFRRWLLGLHCCCAKGVAVLRRLRSAEEPLLGIKRIDRPRFGVKKVTFTNHLLGVSGRPFE